MPPSGGVSGTNGWTQEWRNPAVILFFIIFTCLQLIRLCTKDKDDRSVLINSAKNSKSTMQISLLSSFRNLFSLLRVFPGIPAVTLQPQSLCEGQSDGAHHLLTRRLLLNVHPISEWRRSHDSEG